DKRLAVETEPHPLEYGEFEGTIAEGEYGAGTVMIWDRGTWEPEGDPRKDYARGRRSFRLRGQKLRGSWHLVRTRTGAGGRSEKQPSWLLMKSRDESAREGNGAPDDKPARQQKALPRPRAPEPELATLVREAPSGDDWLHELKFDGYRLLV